ncbi:penicillin-binding protein 1A [Congregibacter variabilis]|uniref:Penicillin-binding protein 1A n=1 Tax=Congregibacter variabilis TaxID=3081200 RepID=A0ABZ0HZG4_9GAMM|nr:penicillin-binding protein 1A [Congregibacter sp. IMCC43200]
MKLLRWPLRLAVLGFLGGCWLFAGIYLYLSPNLPDVETLRDVRLQTPMRVYTRDGDLIGQFGEQKRNPLSYEQIPQQFVQALLAAEDDGFFKHGGIDFGGLLRAVSELLLTGEKGSGGSTLTMQVARNYFLTLERTFMRKFNEMLLAIEIERRLSKEEIFELYVNRVFLGHRSYGFEAASQVYYGKGIAELTLAQHAMLAGIPKSPSRNNPISGPEAGKDRRNWILRRMVTLGYIDQATYDKAAASPVVATQHGARITLEAQYAAEMARRQMVQRYGMAAYNEGYSVYTTLDSKLQQVANAAVIDGLITYDSRHGYRGPEQQLLDSDVPPDAALPLAQWQATLSSTPVIAGLEPAVVTAIDDEGIGVLLASGEQVRIEWENGLRQARPYISEDRMGSAPTAPADVVALGDLVRVKPGDENEWRFAQVPDAQAALVSLNPNNGAIVSLVGGIGFEKSKFNRATQAQRQPGSNLKPFLYSAALNSGFTAASIINDAPIVMQDRSLEGVWRPENDSGQFFGPTRLRWALTKSRNLVSIRLLQQLGIRRFIDYAQELGFDTEDFAPDLSLALGTHAMNPLEIASAYAILANGGYRVEPFLIERIETLSGDTVFEARPPSVCRDCEQNAAKTVDPEELSMEQILSAEEQDPLPGARRVMDERVNFIIDSILQDVIKDGTGRRALVLKRDDLAGKTGTTNGPMDAWFSGYNPDVVTTTWVGFDNYTPLGRREFGGTAALPIWINYMREALKDVPERSRRLPPGIIHVRIDPETGLLAPADQRNAIFEYFRNEHLPEAGEGANTGPTGTDDLIQEIF